MARGRKRRFNPDIPGHIDQDSLPSGIHWHKQRRHWYVTFKDESGMPKKKVVADQYAKLSDLHKQIEHFKANQSGQGYSWLSAKYQKSADFSDLMARTQQDYIYSSNLVENYQTLSGRKLGDLDLSGWNTPMLVKLIDRLGENHGRSAANHALRFTKVLFRWGKNRGFISENHAMGIKQLKENPDQQYVEDPVFYKVLDYARACGSMQQHEPDSCPRYLWAVMVIAYECRLRGSEVIALKEGDSDGSKINCVRLKGSRTNAIRFNAPLRNAWDHLIAERDKTWEARKMAVNINPNRRPLIINKSGDPLKKSALDTAWQRFINRAIEREVITKDERFSLHDLKRKGISDTEGDRGQKMEGSGHRTPSMMDIYDKSVPVVSAVTNDI